MINVSLTIFGLCSIGISLFVILNLLYQRTNAYKNFFTNIQRYLDGVPKELSIVNFGSTFAWHNFDYTNFPVKGFNFALIPQPLSYDYKILKQYHDHIKPNGIVLITLSLFSFYIDYYRNNYSNIKYYFFLNSEYINSCSSLVCLINKKFPLFFNFMLLKKIIRDDKLLIWNAEESATEKNMAVTAKNRIDGWCKQFDFQDVNTYKISSEFDLITGKVVATLRSIIDCCISNCFKPVIVITPVYRQYSGLLSNDVLKKCLYDNIVRANVKNIPTLNYFSDARFQDHSLYINSDCLNKKAEKSLIIFFKYSL
jgi:hypothetical protein